MTRQVVLNCPACLRSMEIVAAGVPEGTQVKCSRCGYLLGDWSSLADQDEETGRPPTPSRPVAGSRGLRRAASDQRFGPHGVTGAVGGEGLAGGFAIGGV